MPVRTCSGPGRLSKMALFTLGLSLFLAAAAVCSAQSKLDLSQIRELPGEEIGRGTNQAPVTDLKLYTYRVESLALPQDVRVKIDGSRVRVNRAWRITISAEHFTVGAMPAVLLIDGQPVAIGQESSDETEVSFIVFNPRVIRSGASLGITYEGDLLIDSRDPDLVTAQFTLPDLEGAQKHLLPETMTITKR